MRKNDAESATLSKNTIKKIYGTNAKSHNLEFLNWKIVITDDEEIVATKIGEEDWGNKRW